ncbi:hypothetical protein [Labilibaculum sp.]|uniref:hypothetical protein n=1 Tax=Labilibaculum sp. TaxID=2060723 RepID=UPI00356499BC
MNDKEDLPFHHYTDTYKKVNIMDGHPVLSLDPNFPFAMTRFGIMDNESQTGIPHRHDYYEILFVEEGLGQHIVDYESYEIKNAKNAKNAKNDNTIFFYFLFANTKL